MLTVRLAVLCRADQFSLGLLSRCVPRGLEFWSPFNLAPTIVGLCGDTLCHVVGVVLYEGLSS